MNRSAMRSIAALSMTVAIVGATLVTSAAPPATAAPSGEPSGFRSTLLTNSGMGTPTSLEIAPDGRVFVFDLYGGIRIFQGGSWLPQQFGSVSVDASGDKGLLGGVFDRQFPARPYLYVFYVGSSDSKVRIGRFTVSGNTGTDFTVLYTAPSSSPFQHAGGGIEMGLDGMLYFGIGDNGTPSNSQSLSNPFGKIHRIAADGSIPSDNPFVSSSGALPSIYSTGMRNPFRLSVDRANGAIFVGDVGFNDWEEINRLVSGGNYGWPVAEGPCQSTCAFVNPVHWYPHVSGTNNTNDSSIVAGPVYRGSAYPASYRGMMFYSDYVQGFIRTTNPSSPSTAFTTFSGSNGSVIDLTEGADGKIYFVTISSPTLYRIDYDSGSGNAAPIAVSSASQTSGPAPLSIDFSSSGSSDPEGATLTYSWDFGDGTTSSQANPSKIYAANGDYTVALTVNDGTTSTLATAIAVTVGVQPTVTIAVPTPTTTVDGGDVVAYSASAVDSGGDSIVDRDLRTTVRLHHSDHSHPFLGPREGGSGEFTIPRTGELSPDIWYRITVQATDSDGLTGSAFVDVHPNTATITVATDPSGLSVTLDGTNYAVPPNVVGVVGLTRQLTAPSTQTLNGVTYQFDRWSDGGARDHTIEFPASHTNYIAYYLPVAPPPAGQNLLPNASFELVDSRGLPTSWTGPRWGNNDGQFEASTNSRTGSRSATLTMTSHGDGGIRMHHTPIAVEPETTYTFRYFFVSTAETKMVADVTLTNGSHQYLWLGINPAASGSWNEGESTFTTPVGAATVAVSFYLSRIGTFAVDDVSLTPPGDTPPPPAAPTVTLSATPSSIQAGASSSLAWTVTGEPTSCTASGGWSGSRTATGTAAVTPTVSTDYTLTCVNSGGSTARTVSVTVTPVAPPPPPPPPPGNIVPNPSFEIESSPGTPASWNGTNWGTNNATFTLETGGAFDGTRSVRSTITSFSSGEAKWEFAPQPALPSTTYTLTLASKATGPTKLLATIVLADGTRNYIWLGTLPTGTTWQTVTRSVTTPPGATSITVGAFLTGIGSIAVDDVSLTPPG